MPKPKPCALILAGGRGTRFWPRSRTKTPKQLLNFLGEGSLLRQTVNRLLPVIPADRVWILANDILRDAIAAELPEVPTSQIIAEPAARNTAPCLGLAAQIIAQTDPDALLGVFPADHYITKPARFRQFVKAAFKAAETSKLVTLGIQPRWPETGYGYLELPASGTDVSMEGVAIKRFCEKPDLVTAKKFLKAGRYFWNAGMFFWRAGAFLSAMRKYLPKSSALLASLPPFEDPDFNDCLQSVYPRLESISVDYGVMEPASKEKQVLAVATDDFGWNDLGSWNAVYELDPGKALRSPVIQHESEGCLVDVPGKTVALVGVKGLVVVDTDDALLIADREKAQNVGQIVKILEQRKLAALL